MNDGADAGNGHIVGVIHEMFLVDGNDWLERDGGAHNVFNKDATPREGPTREILIAGGHDLQERKRLLVQDADALVVLPGGPGTWDEVGKRIGVLLSKAFFYVAFSCFEIVTQCSWLLACSSCGRCRVPETWA